MPHSCHNRTFPTHTVVQDGWVDTVIMGRWVRLPRMVEILFTMSHECHQWGELGAVTKGLMDPTGCDGCRWGPSQGACEP